VVQDIVQAVCLSSLKSDNLHQSHQSRRTHSEAWCHLSSWCAKTCEFPSMGPCPFLAFVGAPENDYSCLFKCSPECLPYLKEHIGALFSLTVLPDYSVNKCELH
jgi:hypothetical protein